MLGLILLHINIQNNNYYYVNTTKKLLKYISKLFFIISLKLVREKEF